MLSPFNAFTFIIGTKDDFDTWEDLLLYWQCGGGHRNSSRFDYEVKGTPVNTENAVLIGQGIAFESDWSMDDTISGMVWQHVIDGYDYASLEVAIFKMTQQAIDMNADKAGLKYLLLKAIDAVDNIESRFEE